MIDGLCKVLSVEEANRLNPLQLALVGDAVFEVFIRTRILLENKELSAHKIHVKAINYVKAHGQSNAVRMLEGELSEDELNIYKRGRNAKSATVPKNADIREYRAATGFEALIGYLYLTDRKERLEEIINKSILFINQSS